MLLAEITKFLDDFAPVFLQESYDNSGLLIGRPDQEVSRALICLDLTEEVFNEALNSNCDLIISHHPLIFGGLKKITGKNETERIVMKAIKKEVAVYAIHTNLDNVFHGVNSILAEKLGLLKTRILAPKDGILRKLVTFCPSDYANQLREALFESGAGHIGNYDSCSFNMEGVGSFRASEEANPFVGEKGKLHFEKEVRIETIYPVFKEKEVLQALFKSHPYEEVAYDLYPLENKLLQVGAGMIGQLPEPMDELEFLQKIKKVTKSKCVRHSELTGKKLFNVAICGGSGSFLIGDAMQQKADAFITGDIKYHDFFRADSKIIIADIGHYESEQFVKELIYSELNEKFSNFAVLISKANTNSVNYL